MCMRNFLKKISPTLVVKRKNPYRYSNDFSHKTELRWLEANPLFCAEKAFPDFQYIFIPHSFAEVRNFSHIIRKMFDIKLINSNKGEESIKKSEKIVKKKIGLFFKGINIFISRIWPSTVKWWHAKTKGITLCTSTNCNNSILWLLEHPLWIEREWKKQIGMAFCCYMLWKAHRNLRSFYGLWRRLQCQSDTKNHLSLCWNVPFSLISVSSLFNPHKIVQFISDLLLLR